MMQNIEHKVLLCNLNPHKLDFLRPILSQYSSISLEYLGGSDLKMTLLEEKYSYCFLQNTAEDLAILAEIELEKRVTKIILLSEASDFKTAIQIFRLGVCDILTLPLEESDCKVRFDAYFMEAETESLPSIGHYRLMEQIGEGGMGTIYSAIDQDLGIEVALKVLKQEFSSEPKYIKQFEREVALLSQVMHQNIVTFFDYHQIDDHIFLSMELLRGQMLYEKQWSTENILHFGLQIAKALSALHLLNIIHLDIKPDNIIVQQDLQVKIIDFGIAKSLDESASGVVEESQEIVASPVYSAPEVFLKAEDFFSDQYSLGCTLFELISGETAFSKTLDLDTLYKEKRKKAPNIRDFSHDTSRAVADVLQKMMEPKKKNRFSSMEDVEDALSSLLEDMKADPMHWVLDDSDAVDLSADEEGWIYEDASDMEEQEHTMGIDLEDILVVDAVNSDVEDMHHFDLPPAMLPMYNTVGVKQKQPLESILPTYAPVSLAAVTPPSTFPIDSEEELHPLHLDSNSDESEEFDKLEEVTNIKVKCST